MKAPIIGIDDAGSMFIITSEGAAASFYQGQWQPGIIFEGRDMMDFVSITDPEKVDVLMNQASNSLTAFLEQHKS